VNIEIIHIDKRIALPDYATQGAAAIDFRSTRSLFLRPQRKEYIKTGVAIHIKDTEVMGMIAPRSGNACKHRVRLANSIGVIDSDYQGEIIICLDNCGAMGFEIKMGDRIAQMVFLPILRPTFTVVDEFSDRSERGKDGFGSTGAK